MKSNPTPKNRHEAASTAPSQTQESASAHTVESESKAPHIHHHIVRQDRNVGRNRQYTTIFLYVLFGILFAAVCVYFLLNGEVFAGIFDTVGSILSPMLIGLAIAYILNPMMEFCEKHLFGSRANHKYNRARRRLLKAKLAYDHLRLAEEPDETAIAQAARELEWACCALQAGKVALWEEQDRRERKFRQKQAKRQKPSFHKKAEAPPAHPHRFPALFCTFLIFILLLCVFAWIVIPQCIDSITEFVKLISYYAEVLPLRIQSITLPEELQEIIDTLNETMDLEAKIVEVGTDAINSVARLLGGVITKLPDLISNTVSGITNLVLGIFMAIYFLSSKEMLMRQFSLLVNACFGQRGYSMLRHVARETDRQFGKFIQGKLIDSLLMMVICFTFFTIADIPYAALITLITVVTNLIPYFGPFIGAIPSGIIILISEPSKVLIFAVLILIIQQIEGNILEPWILGDSMGLAPVWIMVAVLVMGELFGLIGMVLGVPIFSVFYTLVSEFCHKRIAARKKAKKNLFDQSSE